MKVNLYKREIFDKIAPFIGDETVIVLHGARQIGKTHILFYIRDWLVQKSKKVIYFDLEYPELLGDFNLSTEVFISNLSSRGYITGEEIYVLIDEIQYLDNPSSFLKIIADHYKNIRLIVSGSSSFEMKSKFTDSLAGRTTSFEVFPLSFTEYLEFSQSDIVITNSPSLSITNRLRQSYKEFVIYGGYPKVVLEPDVEKKKQYLLQIIDTYIRKDVRDLAGVEDIKKFNNMLEVLASQSGKLLDLASLSRETTISYPTLSKYLTVLEETYVIKRVTPYSKSPSVEISKNPKVFFFDSGLCSLLWLKSFQTSIVGYDFETSVFGELVKNYGRKAIHFWRTKARTEIDFVIERESGSILPIEVKTNFQKFNGRAMESFCKKYKIKGWMVLGLEGEKTSSYFCFPWEIGKDVS